MTSELDTLAAAYLPALEAEMRAVLGASDNDSADDPFLGMIHYHMGWTDAELRPAGGNSGKRIRPLLCLLSCAAAGGDWRQALPAAAAIEILHNFSLVHDDIEDNSPTRRGRATLWTLWGQPQAINTGDAMFAQMCIRDSHGFSPETVNGRCAGGASWRNAEHFWRRFGAPRASAFRPLEPL